MKEIGTENLLVIGFPYVYMHFMRSLQFFKIPQKLHAVYEANLGCNGSESFKSFTLSV